MPETISLPGGETGPLWILETLRYSAALYSFAHIIIHQFVCQNPFFNNFQNDVLRFRPKFRQRIKVPGYTLTYFPIRGRAEVIRLLLADQGASWTDDEVQMQDWAAGIRDLKKNAVFGQIPRFQDGDFVLYQTCTILRYLARKYGISGSNEKEIAIIEMINDGVEDLRTKYYIFLFLEKVCRTKCTNDLSPGTQAYYRAS
ncbi:unnamed protein product [Ranitomeya imitator]|uniref:glutathione transferase n=1 Tax=Ranitomeya imitator TaxID=111125 RepID=A0ABN9MQX0_9NEOB|nr:unnamed protein product [Ranitomeya imitator]